MKLLKTETLLIIRTVFVFGMVYLLSSCGPSIEQLGATISFELTQTKVAEPTSSITPSPTPTSTFSAYPTVTQTKTPTKTPTFTLTPTIRNTVSPIEISAAMTPVSARLGVALPTNSWCRASISYHGWYVFGNPYLKVSMPSPKDDSYIFNIFQFPNSPNRTYSDSRMKIWEFKTFDEKNYEIRYSSNNVRWRFELICEPYPAEE